MKWLKKRVVNNDILLPWIEVERSDAKSSYSNYSSSSSFNKTINKNRIQPGEILNLLKIQGGSETSKNDSCSKPVSEQTDHSLHNDPENTQQEMLSGFPQVGATKKVLFPNLIIYPQNSLSITGDQNDQDIQDSTKSRLLHSNVEHKENTLVTSELTTSDSIPPLTDEQTETLPDEATFYDERISDHETSNREISDEPISNTQESSVDLYHDQSSELKEPKDDSSAISENSNNTTKINQETSELKNQQSSFTVNEDTFNQIDSETKILKSPTNPDAKDTEIETTKTANDDYSFQEEEFEISKVVESSNYHRSSVTPEISSSNQIQIPFTMLQTEEDEYPDEPVEAEHNIETLESTLEEFGVEARVIDIQKGPIITRYELKIPPGIKVNRILSLSDELAMALEAVRVRIEAPIPGRSTVGVEIPNKHRHSVLLSNILNSDEYRNFPGNLPVPLGKDIAGKLLLEDLCKMPHLLIAGATGSGKSVAVNSFITSLILSKSPEEIRLLLVDPKLVELSHFNDIPHLLHPVIIDPQKAILALNWAVEEMERRYEDMAEFRSKDITTYNDKITEYNSQRKKGREKLLIMPYIIILIDELGDLMMVAGKEVENSIIRLSQKARAVGMHLILATQRPSVDVITALIKANCPARIALQVAQKTDSRTILDSNGAEQLLGQGDMLFKHPSKALIIRAQAPLVKDREVEEVVKLIKTCGKPNYITLDDPKAQTGELDSEDEDLFEEAWDIITESQKASASYLQRRLRIGYNRAARIIEAFEARGYIGPQIGSKPREILQ